MLRAGVGQSADNIGVVECLGRQSGLRRDYKELQKSSQNSCGQESQDLRNSPPILLGDRRLAYSTIQSHETCLAWPSLLFSAHRMEFWEGFSLVSRAHQEENPNQLFPTPQHPTPELRLTIKSGCP